MARGSTEFDRRLHLSGGSRFTSSGGSGGSGTPYLGYFSFLTFAGFVLNVSSAKKFMPQKPIGIPKSFQILIKRAGKVRTKPVIRFYSSFKTSSTDRTKLYTHITYNESYHTSSLLAVGTARPNGAKTILKPRTRLSIHLNIPKMNKAAVPASPSAR